MTYNYKNEYKKWINWKKKEEALLKKLHVDDSIIQELRNFDWNQFNSNRRFKRRQNITSELFFMNIADCKEKEFNSIDDILDNIENEALYEYLKENDPIVLSIILMKLQGYSIKEISQLTHLPISTIYHKISKIKKNFKFH